MHATHVVEGENWYNQRIAPEGKKFHLHVDIKVFQPDHGCALVAYGAFKLAQNDEPAQRDHGYHRRAEVGHVARIRLSLGLIRSCESALRGPIFHIFLFSMKA